MSKFAIGEQVENVADDHGALQFFTGEKLAFTLTRRSAA